MEEAVEVICRIGSLEIIADVADGFEHVICRIGSLEMTPAATRMNAARYLPYRQLRKGDCCNLHSMPSYLPYRQLRK